MRILSRKEFMKTPKGTVFSYYDPSYFTELNIKDSGPEYEVDFTFSDLVGAVESHSSQDFAEKCEQMERGASLPVDFEISGREGLFDDKLLYAVYEKNDVEKLIKRLQEANN